MNSSPLHDLLKVYLIVELLLLVSQKSGANSEFAENRDFLVINNIDRGIEKCLEVLRRVLNDLAQLESCDLCDILLVFDGTLYDVFDHFIRITDHGDH